MRYPIAAIALAAALPTTADANVVQQDERGFRVIHIVETDASPQEVWRTLAVPSRWWNGSHSFSGKADNLSLELVPGGCFCERADALSVEHARVIYTEPDVRLRLRGSLGPLQQDAVTGILTFALREREGGGTVLSAEYSVSGNFRMAVGSIAPAVDRVITEQANRLAEAANDPPGVAEDIETIEEQVEIDMEIAEETEEADEFDQAFDGTPEPDR